MILIIFEWFIVVDIVYIRKHYMDGRYKVAANFYRP